jgi:hypothetical protein
MLIGVLPSKFMSAGHEFSGFEHDEVRPDAKLKSETCRPVKGDGRASNLL